MYISRVGVVERGLSPAECQSSEQGSTRIGVGKRDPKSIYSIV